MFLLFWLALISRVVEGDVIRESVALTDWMLRCIEQRVCSLARILLPRIVIGPARLGIKLAKRAYSFTESGRKSPKHPSAHCLVSFETKELLAVRI